MLSLIFKNPVSAINIEAKCCLDTENRKTNIILLGTLVIRINFLLEFYLLSLPYKKLPKLYGKLDSYIQYLSVYLIMSIHIIIAIVKGNWTITILILFTLHNHVARYVNLIKVFCYSHLFMSIKYNLFLAVSYLFQSTYLIWLTLWTSFSILAVSTFWVGFETSY